MSGLSTSRLVWRGLVHHRVAALLVAFGVAVATACVTGSLLIGASMELSLRDQALQRLGRTTHAFTSPLYHKDAFAQSLEQKGFALSRAIRGRGVVVRPASEASVPNVSITAVDASFWSFFPRDEKIELQGRQVAISRSLARDLGMRDSAGPVEPTEALIVTLPRGGGAKAGTLFAHQSAEKTQRKLRMVVTHVLADQAGGTFAVHGGSSAHPRNLFVSRDWFARIIKQPERFNTLLIDASSIEGVDPSDVLASAATLEDLGLKLVAHSDHGYVSVESPDVVLPRRHVARLIEVLERQGERAARTSIYLANTIRRVDEPKRSSAYALVAGAEWLDALPFTKGGGKDPEKDGIWLNEWLAQDLQVDVGARLQVSFPIPSRDGSQKEHVCELMLRGIVALKDSGADPGLSPAVEGITEARSIDAWSLPFPIEKSRIVARDDEYWDTYRTTPKAFLSLALMKELWSSAGMGVQPDWVTSVRIALPPGQNVVEFAARLEEQVQGALSFTDAGAALRPVRVAALAGASGNTDFGQLFMGLSFFIIVSAIGMVISLMRLQAERRAGEVGLLLSAGFSPRRILHLMLIEGAGAALLGSLLGVICGLAYAGFLIHALNSFWSGAVAETTLTLHADTTSMLVGGVFGWVAGLFAAWRGTRGVAHKPVVDLVGGWRAGAVRTETAGRKTLWLGLIFAALAAALIVLSVTGDTVSSVAAFFGAGGSLLIALLLLCHALLKGSWRRPLRPLSVSGLAFRSAALFRGRSLLVMGLLSAASFVLVAVASQRRDPRRLDVTQRDSGAGGFVLRADSAIPLRYDLGTTGGRQKLGFTAEEEALFADAEVVSFLASAGEGISCLNLARPAQPRLLAVSDRMIERGGFRVLGAGDQGWRALQDSDASPVPIFGDAASVQWTLHSGVGKEYDLVYGQEKVKTRFAGVLSGSIFAGELLMGEAAFRRLYPQVDAPTCFLIAAPLEKESQIAAVLRKRLAQWGTQVRPTREILAEFLTVQNTYLSVFLALGGLGLLLGTVGLVAVLVRNVHERRSELALLSASGFAHGRLAGLVGREYGSLLLMGVAIGTCSALTAVIPTLTAADSTLNTGALLGLLISVIVFGLAICALASSLVISGSVVQSLRQE